MLRRVLVLTLVLLLAACKRTDERAAFTDSRLPPGLAQADWPPEGWTWGLIQVGKDPPQRYGVSPALEARRAQVLILPGYDGLAEDEFAAARDFNIRGYVVWVLEGQGQGGSARFVNPRDLGYARDFDGDVGAIRQMAAAVIRPTPAAPLIAIAYGTAAPEALRAAQQGLADASRLILVDPRFQPPGWPVDPAQARLMTRLGLGGWRAPGQGRWRRQAADPDPLRHAWQAANPDLRMGGTSYAWIAAFYDLTGKLDSGDWRRVASPVLIIETGPTDAEAARLCRLMADCRIEAAADAHAAEAAAVEAALPATSLSNPDPGR
ncbi:MAG TPA: alpha/beta hydrolase [Caulobacteraceae bacterium]|jgi:lysophospholipase|nr:alpha/beta hydrolase [Caulobacteraceae bacterium]